MESAEATLDIYDPIHDDVASSFKKVISSGGKECCHFSNTDCNPTGLRHLSIYFHGWLNFNGLAREEHKQVFKCDAGGALHIYGTSAEDAKAVCYQWDGSVLLEALLGAI
ncbi:hypothetical protein BDF21DRAFT_460567 [Thamnidium elegans]|nr:hypothetical protein BDF21DRAFT_460567 [Thamnidium elegans]